jgi:hypothetical protein
VKFFEFDLAESEENIFKIIKNDKICISYLTYSQRFGQNLLCDDCHFG